MPVLRRVLAVVLALSFPTALSVPAQAMGPQCAEQPAAEAAAPALIAHEGVGSTSALPHHAGHHAATASSEAPNVQAPDPGAPGQAGVHHACCLAACPACLPAMAGAPALAVPTGARQSLNLEKTLLPDGLPPGEALDPPRSIPA